MTNTATTVIPSAMRLASRAADDPPVVWDGQNAAFG